MEKVAMLLTLDAQRPREVNLTGGTHFDPPAGLSATESYLTHPEVVRAPGELMGVAVISVIPLLILFLVFQRQFTEGITAGALQGQ